MSELHIDILAALTAATIEYGRQHGPTWRTAEVAGLTARYRGAPVSFRRVARCLGDLRRRGCLDGGRLDWGVP